MLNPMQKEAGFTLVEVLIGVAIVGILLVMGIPSFKNWIQNTQIRTATEAIQNGLELARAEAVRRNTQVRFQLTSTVDNTCALNKASGNWVVSLDNPTGLCASAKLNDDYPATDATHNPAPRIIQDRPVGTGSANVAVASQEVGGGTQYDGSITFNGLGRVIATSVTPGDSVQIDISNPVVGGNCVSAGGPMRCLRVNVSSGGLIRSCNPLWSSIPTSTTPPYDPQGC
jgi:type IV fimbrial biogenesis protein FimT